MTDEKLYFDDEELDHGTEEDFGDYFVEVLNGCGYYDDDGKYVSYYSRRPLDDLFD